MELNFMKRKKYEEFVPEGELIEIPDFLPPPHMLVLPKQRTVKVTLSLTKESIDFFKMQAKRNHVKYQQMIRQVVDIYAQQSMSLDKKQ
jgi:hypothetical protein